MAAPTTIDFETDAIEARPAYPPVPRGVSIWYPGRKEPKYLAWGHPTKNNTTLSKAVEELHDVWAKRSRSPLLFHNAKFDLDVGNVHLGLPIPSWDEYHDTLFLLFLHDPHAPSISLKPAAEKLLNMPPEEQEAVRQWLVRAGVVSASLKGWGAHICKAPGDIVGEYAKGDVLRTRKLFDLLYPVIKDAGMGPAYDRERKLLPILMENEHRGIRLDTSRLEKDYTTYTKMMNYVDYWLRKALKAPTLNVDSNDELAAALQRSGAVANFKMTATGKPSVSKKNLTPEMFTDPEVSSALGYRNRLATCLGTFMEPWLEMATKNKGYIFTNWNQVRQSHGTESGGTRTGRLSCSPNFQNIPKTWGDKGDDYTHPTHLNIPELPLMRMYLLPDNRHVFGHRDYNQQELRILAHFEDDKLCAAYRADPRLDVHDFVQAAIHQISGLELERRAVKVLNFGMVYGMGLGKLALGIKRDIETARRIKQAQRGALPGLAVLERDIKMRGAAGDHITTWGGRHYYVEPPKMIDGQMRTFEYKLLNYLIQGSAADCTKEAVIRYAQVAKEGRFLVTVHDEINISAPKGAMHRELQRLKEAMESVEFDVPMLTDAKVGISWGELKSLKEAA